MAINISNGFKILSFDSIDTRFVLSKSEMLAMKDGRMPEKYFAVCKDDGFLYLYNKTATPNGETGKFSQLIKVDDKSIIYLTEDGLSIKGYSSATQGQMLVKDSVNGLSWVNPVSDASLQEAVQQAQASATQAGTSATTAGNYAGQAIAAKIAVENKFWYGTIAEYNALETVHKDTIYIILDK